MRFALVLALSVVTLAFGLPLFADHGNKALDLTKVVIVKDATVTNFLWKNPNALLMFDAKDASGNVVHWAVKTAPPNALKPLGWTPTVVEPGDKVTVYLWQVKGGSPGGRLDRIVLPDGSVLKDTSDNIYGQQFADPLVATCLASSQSVCYAHGLSH